MQPTEEQQLVISSKFKRIKIIAFAGAAKSTTLAMYANARPDSRILLVCFNKANQLEAEKKFPGNVTSLTTHALAMKSVGVKYKHKLVPNLRVNDITFLFNVNYQTANAIISTLNRYLVSSDETLSDFHIDAELVKNKSQHGFIVSKARELFNKMSDPSSPVGMLHDGYLKLYQLSKPNLSATYDIILFEESQDSNDVTTDIIQSQSNCGLVVVGDPHQSIYSFRGSNNALDKFKTEHTYFLTKSFRFGRGVANVANALLSKLKGEKNTVVGAGKFPETQFSIDRNKYHAIIARTNAALFDEAVFIVTSGKTPHFVGGVKNYRMSDILDAYYLYAGMTGNIKGHLKAFNSWYQFEMFADESKDAEANILRKIVMSYTHQIPDLITLITNKSVDDPSKAHVSLMTAHKSKGLEFDQVLLVDDFPEFVNADKINPEITAEDINLMYVAVTRAERAIALNSSLIDFMKFVGGSHSISNKNQASESNLPQKPIANESSEIKQSIWLTGAIASADKRDVDVAIEDVKKLLKYLEDKKKAVANA